jgi:hypothetical protein
LTRQSLWSRLIRSVARVTERKVTLRLKQDDENNCERCYEGCVGRLVLDSDTRVPCGARCHLRDEEEGVFGTQARVCACERDSGARVAQG